jgi:hypothetical protein
MRRGLDAVPDDRIRTFFDLSIDDLRDETRATFEARRLDVAPKGVAALTVTREAASEFKKLWTAPDGPVSLVPGKETVSHLSAILQAELRVSIGASQIASHTATGDLPPEIVNVLRAIQAIREPEEA